MGCTQERYGIKYWIKDETLKTEAQLENWIQAQLNGTAQVIAHNLLHDLRKMSHVLYTFIITSYEDTIHSGKFNSTQAWEITSSFSKQIFTEIGYAGVSASDVKIIGALWSSGSGIVFPTIHAHSVMSVFMCFSIKYYPSICLEMVKFLFYSMPSTNMSQLLICISAVKYFLFSDQSNLS